MYPINHSFTSSFGAAVIQSKVDISLPESGTGAQLERDFHGPLTSRALSSTLKLDPVRRSSDPLPHSLSLDNDVSNCRSNSLCQPQSCARTPCSVRQQSSSSSSLGCGQLSPMQPPTTLPRNETGTIPESVNASQQLNISLSHPVPLCHQDRILSHSTSSDHSLPSNFHNLIPRAQPLRRSYSGDTLVDEPEPLSGLGSAALLEGSTELNQRCYQNYGAIQRRVPARHITTMGQILPSQQDHQIATSNAVDIATRTGQDMIGPGASMAGTERRRQLMGLFHQIDVGMAQHRQNSEFPLENRLDMASSTREMPIRGLINSETEIPRIAPRKPFASQFQVTPFPTRVTSTYHARFVARSHVLYETLDMPPYLPASGITRFNRQLNTDRWQGNSSARPVHPPRPALTMTTVQAHIRGSTNFARFPGPTTMYANTASRGGMNFRNRQHFAARRPISGQAAAAMQSMMQFRSFSGRHIIQGRGRGQ